MGHTATAPANQLRINAGALALSASGLSAHATATTTEVTPDIGSHIAGPDVEKITYECTPLKQLQPWSNDRLAPIAGQYGELSVPFLILSSSNDHVAPPKSSEHLRDTTGGRFEFVTLERSFHVATQDFDQDLISERSLAFIGQVES